MALSSKALQKKRTKKATKRKETRKNTSAAANSQAMEWLSAAHAPVADVYVPEQLFDTGIGSVWFSRVLDDGRYALSVFLVDTFCLGVKNAMYGILDAERYRVNLENFLHISEEEFIPQPPEYVRKLVESYIGYAQELGLRPHKDYEIAKVIFGNVEASASDAEFRFGRDGQPVYIPGPGDSPAEQRRIIQQLEKVNKDPYALLMQGLND